MSENEFWCGIITPYNKKGQTTLEAVTALSLNNRPYICKATDIHDVDFLFLGSRSDDNRGKIHEDVVIERAIPIKIRFFNEKYIKKVK